MIELTAYISENAHTLSTYAHLAPLAPLIRRAHTFMCENDDWQLKNIVYARFSLEDSRIYEYVGQTTHFVERLHTHHREILHHTRGKRCKQHTYHIQSKLGHHKWFMVPIIFVTDNIFLTQVEKACIKKYGSLNKDAKMHHKWKRWASRHPKLKYDPNAPTTIAIAPLTEWKVGDHTSVDLHRLLKNLTTDDLPIRVSCSHGGIDVTNYKTLHHTFGKWTCVDVDGNTG